MRAKTMRHLTLILLASVSLAAWGKKEAAAPDVQIAAPSAAGG